METKDSYSPNRPKNKEKKGAGFFAALLSKLGLGGTAAGGATGAFGAASVGVGATASNVGIVALVVVGMGGVAGISFMNSGSDSNQPVAGGSLFASAEGRAASDSMGSADVVGWGKTGEAVPASAASSSLDYFNEANQGAVKDPTKTEEVAGADAGADAPADDAEEIGSGVEAPDNSNGSGGNKSSARAASVAPKMVKAASSFQGSSSRSSGVTLLAQGGLSSGISGGFDKTYKAPVQSVSTSQRSRTGARSASSVKRGNSALNQASNVNKTHKGYSRGGQGMTSANVGADYDGGRVNTIGAKSSEIRGPGGEGSGGLSSSKFKPNRSLDTKELPEPKKVEKAENKTPYQKTIKKAMMAIAAAGLLLMAAGMAKKSQAPWAAMAVKVLAGLAAAAAMVAMQAGMELVNKYNQQMQGMMFAGMGAIILFQSGMVLYDAFASEKAEAAKKIVETEGGETTKTLLNGTSDPVVKPTVKR